MGLEKKADGESACSDFHTISALQSVSERAKLQFSIISEHARSTVEPQTVLTLAKMPLAIFFKYDICRAQLSILSYISAAAFQ
jgi:hypothetical protein